MLTSSLPVKTDLGQHGEFCSIEHWGIGVQDGKPFIEIYCANHDECFKLAIPEGCYCRTPGMDDGDTTCFMHHDCQRGDCTHQE